METFIDNAARTWTIHVNVDASRGRVPPGRPYRAECLNLRQP
jgi:hypothetical protein